MNALLAKSGDERNPRTWLVNHTRDVVEAGEALFGSADLPTRLGRAWLRFFKVSERSWLQFHDTLLASALFHDWGKANQDMQNVLTLRSHVQLFRHEHVSVLLLGYEGVDRWIRQRSDIDWDIVLAAVGSHHLRFSDEEFAVCIPREAVRLLTDHEHFQDHLVPFISERLSLANSPHFPKEAFWGFTDDRATFDPSDLRETLKNGRLAKLAAISRNGNSPQSALLRAVRAGLIVADAAGSGLPRTARCISDWIITQFDDRELCDSFLIGSIIDQRIADLKVNGKWTKWNSFQERCDTISSRSLLLAPCGAGKTLAAWRWIAAQVKREPVKRVLFLYPTRATATEGFKDYVSWAPGADAGLLHGTAEYDLGGMFPAEDPRSSKMFLSDPRLFALRHWTKRVFSGTVDQFLAFMNYSYGPLCLLPLLADSAVVIDEVHSFDHQMFSALLGFLKTFDVPVLCMTATLPQARQDQLTELGLELCNPKPDDLMAIATAPRYRVRVSEEAGIHEHVRQALRDGKRVLWVVNQVSRAQEIVKYFAENLDLTDEGQACLHGLKGTPIVVYHSRFRLNDRVARHREVVAKVRPGNPTCLVITTQVCEMSLDIDADLLVTEACPISSLIQRMGRCRRGREELAEKGPGDVLVYHPAREQVYSPDDLLGLSGFLTFVTSIDLVSQVDLEQGMRKYGSKAVEAPRMSSFLTSGPYAMSREDSFRDIEAFNQQSILVNEVSAYLCALPNEQAGFVVPVPRKLKPSADSRLPHYLMSANERHYHPATGYWDKPIR